MPHLPKGTVPPNSTLRCWGTSQRGWIRPEQFLVHEIQETPSNRNPPISPYPGSLSALWVPQTLIVVSATTLFPPQDASCFLVGRDPRQSGSEAQWWCPLTPALWWQGGQKTPTFSASQEVLLRSKFRDILKEVTKEGRMVVFGSYFWSSYWAHLIHQSKLPKELLGRLRSGGSLFEASPGKSFTRPYLQNNQSKMDLRYDSSRRVTALQAQSLKSTPNPTQTHKKNLPSINIHSLSKYELSGL
jgi:hypothetical protein